MRRFVSIIAVLSTVLCGGSQGLASPVTNYVQRADIWDNGYDNVHAPRQSTFARFVFTTTAPTVTIAGTTTIYASYPSSAHLGVRVNGVTQSPLVFSANGSRGWTVSLPGAAGSLRTVEVIAGSQSAPPPGTVIGTFIDSVVYDSAYSFAVQPPKLGGRILIYGSSTTVGAAAADPESNGYAPLLRTTYGLPVAVDAWGYRSLNDDANTVAAQNAFVAHLVSYAPSTVVLFIGSNDYGLNKWSAANFGAAFAAVMDGLHAALPTARILCVTATVRTSEGPNNFGNTMEDYRTAVKNACNARSWATLVDGKAIYNTSYLASDGIHPTAAGHVLLARYFANILGQPAGPPGAPGNLRVVH